MWVQGFKPGCCFLGVQGLKLGVWGFRAVKVEASTVSNTFPIQPVSIILLQFNYLVGVPAFELRGHLRKSCIDIVFVAISFVILSTNDYERSFAYSFASSIMFTTM